MSKKIEVVATGGTNFDVHLVRGSEQEFLGNMQFGSINSDNQYEQDDSEVIDAVRAKFAEIEGYPDSMFRVR